MSGFGGGMGEVVVILLLLEPSLDVSREEDVKSPPPPSLAFSVTLLGVVSLCFLVKVLAGLGGGALGPLLAR